MYLLLINYGHIAIATKRSIIEIGHKWESLNLCYISFPKFILRFRKRLKLFNLIIYFWINNMHVKYILSRHGLVIVMIHITYYYITHDKWHSLIRMQIIGSNKLKMRLRLLIQFAWNSNNLARRSMYNVYHTYLSTKENKDDITHYALLYRVCMFGNTQHRYTPNITLSVLTSHHTNYTYIYRFTIFIRPDTDVYGVPT